MNISLKTAFFNALRQIFKLTLFEKWLVGQVKGKDSTNLYYRMVPHSHTYSESDFRICKRNGVAIKVFLKDYLGHCIYFNYNNPELLSYDILFRLINDDSICIDVGANIGYISLGMAAKAKNGRVIGFEPDPVNFNEAVANVALNKLSNIEILPYGLGEKASEQVIAVQLAQNRGRNRIDPSVSDGTKVNVIALDDFIREKDINKVTFLKIDVEGYEYKVLKGAKDVLSTHHPMLFVEIDDDNLNYQGDSAKELIRFLNEVGYTKLLNAQTNEVVTERSDFRNLHFDLIAIR